jgi:hypothetical protein
MKQPVQSISAHSEVAHLQLSNHVTRVLICVSRRIMCSALLFLTARTTGNDIEAMNAQTTAER